MSAATESPTSRLAGLGLTLPPPPSAVANYEAFSRVGSLIVTSGQLPWVEGRLLATGVIGETVSIEEGRRACERATLNALAQVGRAAGSLDGVRIVRVEGVLRMRQSASAPHVLDGASDLINSVFAERGRHSRMIHLADAVALDAPCLVVLWAEAIESDG